MDITDRLLDWYDKNRRDFPFRGTSDPYRVWVSEIMLQQTGTETVKPYYIRFIARYPTLPSLARADEDDVMKLWEGLGYYSRARNLLACARVIENERGGEFPRTAAELALLPGIGAYTAAAVASIAFGERIPAMDGNLKRVFARLYRIRDSIDRPDTARRLYDLALESIPADRPGDMNQALMDLGATLCVPGTPDCPRCPLKSSCLAGDDAAVLPVRDKKKPQITEALWVCLCTLPDGRIAVTRREKGLLRGLYLFPVSPRGGEAAPPAEEGQTGCSVLAAARHVFTHRIWEMTVCHTPYDRERAAVRGQKVIWIDPDELDALAFPGAMRVPLKEAVRLGAPTKEDRHEG